VKKHFFFEKKKQKTFDHFLPGDGAASRVKSRKSFLRAAWVSHLFFKKAAAYLLFSR